MVETVTAFDQADRLRKIVSGLREKSDSIIDQAAKKINKKARLIAVTSGKGGVGKTSLTVNMAIQLSRSGYRVIVIDGDLGLANVEVMMGIVPKYSMYEFINSNLHLSDIIADGPSGIKFISGGTGIVEMARLEKKKFDKILFTMSALDNYADFILVDTGAGISNSVTSFVLAANEVILITNAEPTSITDAYAILKIISLHNEDCKVRVIANMVDNSKEAEDIFTRINTAAKRFLKKDIINLGYLQRDAAVSKAIKLQIPFAVSFPKSTAAKGIEEIVKRIIADTEFRQDPEGVKRFLSKIYISFSSSL